MSAYLRRTKRTPLMRSSSSQLSHVAGLSGSVLQDLFLIHCSKAVEASSSSPQMSKQRPSQLIHCRLLMESNSFVVWQIVLCRILVDTAGSVGLRSSQCCRTSSSIRLSSKAQSMAVRPKASNRSGFAPAESRVLYGFFFFAYIAS